MRTSDNPSALSEALATGLKCLVKAEGRATFKGRLERLLYDLPPDESDALMMLLKESRGAVALLLDQAHGEALFVGNAMSGTPLALATLGLHVTVVDTSELRVRFAVERGKALAPGTTRGVVAGASSRLPFVDCAFDVTFLEGGLPSPKTGWGFDLREARRVTRSELIATADNRLGYKRSTGRRGRFRRDPRVLLREIILPRRGEATLPVTRARVVGAAEPKPWVQARAFSLYPHALEFSHIVALDESHPRLTIGPRERKNRIKMLGHSLGLFRWLTPSFAIHARRRHAPDNGRTAGRDRLTRLLQSLSEAIQEETPLADILVATRSNDALIHTAPASGARLSESSLTSSSGHWTLHIPLQPSKRRMVAAHHEWLVRLSKTHPEIPIPAPLFQGSLEGTELAVERRLGGLSGTDVTGNRLLTRRMFLDAARHAAALLDTRTTRFDPDLRDELLTPRFDRVERLVQNESTRRELRRLRDRVEERVVGADVRLGVYHADLRGKHVQVDSDGRVIGYLDWGASEPRFLPFIDLLHLVVHQRKQEVGGRFGDAWRVLLDPRARRDYEQEAFEAYLEHSGLPEEDLTFYLETYPLFVAGMAERNWDYSRPDWVHRQFGI
ncbi:MAG: phosphotransferase [Planctomycetota bacterium]